MLGFTVGILFITYIFRGANPDFTSDELLYQLQATKASVIIVHPEALDTALSAVRAYGHGISGKHIVLFDVKSPSSRPPNHLTIEDLIYQGHRTVDPTFVERRLRPGEAKLKLAFLSFSSGTTGKPKVGRLLIRISGYCIALNYCRPLLFLTLPRSRTSFKLLLIIK